MTTPENYRAAFLAAGGCLLLKSDDWLDIHRRAGRKPAETAALTRRVESYDFDAFVAAVRAEPVAVVTAQPPERPAKPTRPVLRYHGGKWKLAPWILSHFPAHRVYTECFGGAASVLMRKPRSYAEVYNDLDGDMVTLFRVLQSPEQSARLIDLLKLTPFARDEFELAYVPAADPVERARRLCIRATMGFGSNGHNGATKTGFRSNSNRSGTTPARDWATFPENLKRIIGRTAGVVIENRDALEVMQQHDGPTTLHYVDPPYVRSTRSQSCHRAGMYSHEMTDEQHETLAAGLGGLTGMVIVSGYHSPLYDRLFDGWARQECDALADGALDRTEVLWFNERATAAESPTLFQEVRS